MKNEQSSDRLEVNKTTNNAQSLLKIVRITAEDDTYDEAGKRRANTNSIRVTNNSTTVTGEVDAAEASTSLKYNASRNALKTKTEESEVTNSNRKPGEQ